MKTAVRRSVGDRPNIVFIMADDLGYAHLGCYGQEKIKTPHIDRLASEGTRFTQYYAGCAVCAPCRSVLMTGNHMGHTSVRANSGGVPLLDSDVTVAEVLKNVGYATGGFGKWGIGDAHTEGAAYNQGFDEFFGYYDQVHAHSYYPRYLWHNDRKHLLPDNDGRESDGLTGDVRGQYTADEIMSKARDFIRRHKDQPFFCYIPATVPHTELLVPQDSLSEYEAMGWPEPNPYITERKHYQDQPKPRAAFAAMVTRLDNEVGRIMGLLKELGVEQNTIVFFTSDNGGQGSGGPDLEFFQGNRPLRGAKGMMYEGGIRVPMIARWPGRVAAGAVSDQVWYAADVMATLAELAGASSHVPAGVDSLSMAPTLLGRGNQKQHEYLYWELGSGQRMLQAVRLGDWKAVKSGARAPLEIYDLSTDIGETRNLANDRPDVAFRMIRILESARTEPRPQVEPPGVNGWAFR